MSKHAAPFVIGCDGGGTGCRVAVADLQGHMLAQAAGGPANAASAFDVMAANVSAGLADVALQLGLSMQDLMRGVAHFGLAGVMTPQDASRVAAAFPFAQICVTEDRVVAVAGALGAADGVLIAIGTGTIVAARRGLQAKNVGGWGLKLSDQASGAWLGRGLLEHALLCHDGLEEHTDLTRAAFADFGDDPARLVAFAARAFPADYARFAPQIIAAAKAGDAAGQMLMRRGAAYLIRALEAVDFAKGDALCLTGGVAPHYALYLPVSAQDAIVPPQGSALDGALRLALQAAREMEGAP